MDDTAWHRLLLTHERVSLCPRRDAGGKWTPAMKRVRTQWSLGPNCWGTRWWSGYQRRLLPLNAQVRGLGTSCPRKGELLCACPVSAIRGDPGSAAGPRAERWGHRTEDRCSVSARLEAPPPPVQILETSLLHPSVKAAAGTRPFLCTPSALPCSPSIAVITLCVFEAWLSFLTFSNFP